MNICLFTQEEITKPLSKKDERGEHIIKILHKKAGDTFTAGILGGQSGTATINKIDDEGIFFTFEPSANGKPLNPLKMIIGFPRPIQLKRLLRDIAALGVCEVHLTGTELGEKSYMQSTLVEKGNAYKMLYDGTVQAGSTFVPELFLHKTLSECLSFLDGSAGVSECLSFLDGKSSIRLALDNKNPAMRLQAALEQKVPASSGKEQNQIVAAIGSERGWTDKERSLLEANGFIRCGMGERIMRTETAATVAGSIILNYMECL